MGPFHVVVPSVPGLAHPAEGGVEAGIRATVSLSDLPWRLASSEWPLFLIHTKGPLGLAVA